MAPERNYAYLSFLLNPLERHDPEECVYGVSVCLLICSGQLFGAEIPTLTASSSSSSSSSTSSASCEFYCLHREGLNVSASRQRGGKIMRQTERKEIIIEWWNWDQTVISIKVYGFHSVTFHSFLGGLIKIKEKGETFLSFLSPQLADLLFVCPSFPPSLPPVCSPFFHCHLCLPLVHLFMLLYTGSHLITSILPCIVFGSFLLVFQLGLWKPQKLHAPLLLL